MMKILATAAVGAMLALTTGPALADGMARGKGGAAAMPHHSGCGDNKFGGFFAGVHGGWATVDSRSTDLDGAAFGTPFQATEESDGIGFGGQVGFNVQRCSVVWGVVADLSWADLDSSKTYGPAGTQFITNRSADWYGTLRTRLGLAFDGLWLYTTGGFAFADFSLRGEIPGTGTARLFDDTRWGWVGGVGTEYKWTDRVSVVSELLYMNFGTETGSADFGAGAVRFDDHQSMWVSRIGLNIKLGDHGGMMHDHGAMK